MWKVILTSFVAQVGNAMGTVWNSWQTQWSGVSVSNDIVSQTNRTTSSANWWGTTITSFQDTVTRTTTTTTEQQTRTGINTQVIAQIDEEYHKVINFVHKHLYHSFVQEYYFCCTRYETSY